MRNGAVVALGGAVLALLVAEGPLAAQVPFIRGDANGDGHVDISDPITIFNELFGGQPGRDCDDAVDANNDGARDVSDPITLLNFLFGAGVEPPPPYPDCGHDDDVDGDDGLGCKSYPQCAPDCLSVADAEALIEGSIPKRFCVEPDAAGKIPVGDLFLSVCPLSEAQDCDAGDGPVLGCPIELSEVNPNVDLEFQEVTVGITGSTDDFPVVITDKVFGNTLVCTVDMMFSAEVAATFDATKAGNVMTIHSFAFVPESLDDAEISFAADGGVLCDFLEATQDQVIDPLREQLEPLVEDLIMQLNTDFGETEVCCNE